MASLYELSEKMLSALEIFADMDDCSEEEKQEAQGIIGQIAESFNDKAVNVAMYIRNLEAEAQAINEAKKNMDSREKALNAKADRLKNYLLSEMQRTETKQIKSPYFVISTRTNAPSVKIDSNIILPDALLLPPKPREPDKKAIKEMLEQGMVIDGCRLERSQSLSIK